MADQQIGRIVISKGRIISWQVPVQLMEISDYPEKGQATWISDCPLLHIASHGHTNAEASKSMKDMIQIHLEELLDMGTLDHVMVEYGWKKNVVEERAEEDEAIWVTPQISYGYAMAGA